MTANVDKFLAWLYSLFILLVSSLGLTVNAVTIACGLALILVCADFISGVIASKYEGQIVKLRSKRMRWSFSKLVVYTGAVAFTVIIGIGLHSIEVSTNPTVVRTGTLEATLYIVRVEVYFIIWIEVVSIIENLRRRFPDIEFLKILHYIVAVDFVKKIPKLADYLKEKDAKNICGDSNHNSEKHSKENKEDNK